MGFNSLGEDMQKAKNKELVLVENLTHTYFVQPSTGIRIEAKQRAELKVDGWLKNQLDAKLMKEV